MIQEDTERSLTSLSDEQLESRRIQLVNDCMTIQEQLGNKDRRHPDGSRFSNQEFWHWRGSATYALNAKQQELRALKAEKHRRYTKGTNSYDRLRDMLERITEAPHFTAALRQEAHTLLQEVKP